MYLFSTDLRYPLPLLGGYFMGFAIIIHVRKCMIHSLCTNGHGPFISSASFHLSAPLVNTHSFLSSQLAIFWSAQEYILAEHLLHWLQEFNITVTTIEKIFPSTKPRLDRFYAQVLSFAKAYESTLLKVHMYIFLCEGDSIAIMYLRVWYCW